MSTVTDSAVRLRTCIASRSRKPDTELLRLVVDPTDSTRIIPDPRRRLPGRGAWISPTLSAVDQAANRRIITRALRAKQAVNINVVRDYVAALNANKDMKGKTEH